jgi:hypothetical protein
VERRDVMRVILQDAELRWMLHAELRWMLRDKRLHRIPALQATGKNLGQSRLLI